MSTKRSLLEKYDIPVNHLDYQYIDQCSNGKEMEKIVAILRSGQEGYFPHLTEHAENKLKILKPQSKVLREESVLVTRGAMSSLEWQEVNEPVLEWINDMREKDRVLSNVPEDERDIIKPPPIRDGVNRIEPTVVKTNVSENKDKNERIKSTEYNKWDKYDADVEELKIDLEEERAREEIERMNRLNLKKSAEIQLASADELDLDKLTAIEKETLASKYRERGNDYFRAKEYKEAVWEYTQCIKVFPLVQSYNNRALSYFKLNDYKKCIEDCDNCLEIEPSNVKALLRKAQAYLLLDKRREAYTVYAKVLSIEPNNTTANSQIRDLQKQLIDLPPISATRIRIIEEDDASKNQEEDVLKEKSGQTVEGISTTSSNQQNDSKENSKKSVKIKETDPETKKLKPGAVKKGETPKRCTTSKTDIDLSELIVPNKIVKSKFKAAVKAIGNIQKQSKVDFQKATKSRSKALPPQEVKLFPDKQTPKKDILIEEI